MSDNTTQIIALLIIVSSILLISGDPDLIDGLVYYLMN